MMMLVMIWVLMPYRFAVFSSSEMKMEAVCFSETLASPTNLHDVKAQFARNLHRGCPELHTFLPYFFNIYSNILIF
jgi:hypothetical protein